MFASKLSEVQLNNAIIRMELAYYMKVKSMPETIPLKCMYR